jgi:hypothetical protein
MLRSLTTLVPTLAVLALAATGCGGSAASDDESASTAKAPAEIATIKRMLDEALAQYRRGAAKAADRTVGDAYLDHFEALEEPLDSRDHELMEKLEHRISTEIRDEMRHRASATTIAATVAETKRELDRAAAALGSG